MPTASILALGGLRNIASVISPGKTSIVSSGGNTGTSPSVVEFLWEDAFFDEQVAVSVWPICPLGYNAIRPVALSMVSGDLPEAGCKSYMVVRVVQAIPTGGMKLESQ